MSFLSVLHSIGHALSVGVADLTKAAPVLTAIPVAGPLITTVLGAVSAVEGLIPQTGAGTAKKAVVTAIANAAVPGVDASALSSLIDQVVTGLNTLAAAHTAAAVATPPA